MINSGKIIDNLIRPPIGCMILPRYLINVMYHLLDTVVFLIRWFMANNNYLKGLSDRIMYLRQVSYSDEC